MSPHIRSMLEDAADDGGRPLPVDLTAVRAAGRRLTWRHRAIVGGGGLGAAAVITTIALALGPGTSPAGFAASPGQPSGPPTDAPVLPWDQSLAPLFEAIEASGYELADGEIEGIGMSVKPGESPEPGDVVDTLTTTGYPIASGETRGAVTVAEFTDVSLFLEEDRDRSPVGAPPTQPCAVLPPDAALEAFAWERCDQDGPTTRAIGSGERTSAIGVTVLRADGSGLSITLSTAGYGDPPHGAAAPVAPPLDDHPLSQTALAELVSEIAEAGVVFPADMLPGPAPTGSEQPTSQPQGSDPCEGAAPAFDECVEVASGLISTDPLVDPLVALGLEVTSGYHQQSVDDVGARSAVLNFHLKDAQGRLGSAAIGVYDSLDAASLLTADAEATGVGTTWCAVAPSELVGYAWAFADDPSATCSGFDSIGADQTVVFVHEEADGDAIAATLVRADGSVVSVSVSQAPSATISSLPAALPEVPLDRAAILEVLRGLGAGE